MTQNEFIKYCEKYNKFLDTYMPDEGQGNNFATQVIVCVNRLVHDCLNNGEYLHRVETLFNCLTMADWLYDNYKPFRGLCIKYELDTYYPDIATIQEYAIFILMPLMKMVFTEEFYNKYCKVNIRSNIYDENINGKFTSIQVEYSGESFEEEKGYNEEWN